MILCVCSVNIAVVYSAWTIISPGNIPLWIWIYKHIPTSENFVQVFSEKGGVSMKKFLLLLLVLTVCLSAFPCCRHTFLATRRCSSYRVYCKRKCCRHISSLFLNYKLYRHRRTVFNRRCNRGCCNYRTH